MGAQRRPTGCLFGVLGNLLGAGAAGGGAEGEVFPYRKKPYLLTKGEHAFYQVLEQAVGRGHRVFCQIRLADLVYVERGTGNWQSYRNRIDRKTVDFVVCEGPELRPVMVVELDDVTHEREDRRKRDAFVDQVLEAAGMPVVHVKARREYGVEEVRQALGKP